MFYAFLWCNQLDENALLGVFFEFLVMGLLMSQIFVLLSNHFSASTSVGDTFFIFTGWQRVKSVSAVWFGNIVTICVWVVQSCSFWPCFCGVTVRSWSLLSEVGKTATWQCPLSWGCCCGRTSPTDGDRLWVGGVLIPHLHEWRRGAEKCCFGNWLMFYAHFFLNLIIY